ncbi:hypothetical protein [Ottowia caeni]|uniref:hypothetical protein n=1 Tax=Ottowia caeni TaxID=2870339 RepID=UPI003D7282C5
MELRDLLLQRGDFPRAFGRILSKQALHLDQCGFGGFNLGQQLVEQFLRRAQFLATGLDRKRFRSRLILLLDRIFEQGGLFTHPKIIL